MAFRKSIPQQELGKHLTSKQRNKQATEYRASRGGWLPARDKPVPGTPKSRTRK